jgi:hypothetical protein
MTIEARAFRACVLRGALERRLDEVRVRLDQSLVAGRLNKPHVAPADDPSETLRVFMVRFWPRVARGVADQHERASFDEHLQALSEAARSEDLRFLDAWNNAYEALGDDLGEDFLHEYGELLGCHVRRLAVK